jgi:hypothetical protein
MLTPDEQEAVDIARAKQKAKQRDAEAQAAANPLPSGWPMLKEFGRSVGEGLTGTLDLPNRILTGVENLPARLSNAASPAGGEYVPGVNVDELKSSAPPIPLIEPDNHWSGTYNQQLPPNPDYPETRKVGNIAGSVLPAIVAPEALAGNFMRLPVAALDTAATTAGVYGGGKGGRFIDQSLGGSGDTGEFFGSLVGSGVTPLVSNVTSRLTTDAQSPARFNDAVTAGVENPDLSLVGNDWASRWGSKSNQAVQQAQLDRTLRDTAQGIRQDAANGPVQPTGPISRADIGQGVVNAAQQGAERAAADAQGDVGLQTGLRVRIEKARGCVGVLHAAGVERLLVLVDQRLLEGRLGGRGERVESWAFGGNRGVLINPVGDPGAIGCLGGRTSSTG